MTARRDSSNASRPAPAPAWPMPRGRRRGATVSLRLAMPPAVARRRCCRRAHRCATSYDAAARRGWGRTAVGRQSTRSPSTPCAAIDGSAAIFASTQWVGASRSMAPARRPQSALRGRATGGLLATGLLALGAGLCGLGPCGRDGQSVGEFLRHGQGRQAAGSGLPAYHDIARSRRGLPLRFHCAGAPGAEWRAGNGAAGQSVCPDHHGVQHGADLFRPAVAEPGWARRACHLVPPVLAGPAGCCRACGRPGGQAMRDVCLPLAAQHGQALIESVLLLSLLTLLLHAALGLGRAQLAAMQLGNSSRKAAMTAARRQAMSLARRAQWRGPARRRAGGSRRIRVRREPVLAQRLVGRGPAAAGARRYDGRYATAVFRFAHQSPGPGAERGGTCTG